ncbi:hypothetical protein ACN4EE_00625 [Geminocystis sp. CENA526]|uniref:hypothetical protein n=1 Tax=Geminocystis sp. CENA526 TaxID=1355871 RepID=UPI003D6EF219
MSQDRLDRLEALADKILQGLAQTKQTTDQLVQGLEQTKQTTDQLVQGLEQTKQTTNQLAQGLEQTRQRTDSNARAIEALTNQWTEDRKQWEKDREQWEKDRKGLYLLLGRLTRSMADFYEIQSDFYSRFDQIDDRQAKIAEILRELREEENQSENQE